MVNWSGTLTNNNPTGTSTGLNSSLSLNDTGASWPDLSNWRLEITGGLGVGQIRNVLINTAITISITSAWDVIPDATSTYELVLVLRDDDHIVGNLSFDNGLITELEDSATIYIDGNYTITFLNDVKVNWGKTKSTLATFKPNQIEVQGKAGFWGYIYFQSSISNTIYYSYIYIINGNYGNIIAGSVGTGDFSNIHHLRTNGGLLNFFYRGAYSADTQNTKVKYLLHEGQYGACDLYLNHNSNNAFTEEFDTIWVENCFNSGIDWGSNLSAKKQIVRNAIFKKSFSPSDTDIRGDVDKRIFLIDSYFSTVLASAWYAKGSNVDTNGITYVSRNYSLMSQEVYNTYAHDMAIISRFNDSLTKQNEIRYNYAFNITAATEITSDNDYIAGRLSASPQNVDLSELTTSDNNPVQYFGLTAARTNAKATPNKLLECDNIQTSNLTSSSIDITFDCKNSHAGTTVDQDSNSGQKVLYVTDTTDFEVEETVEIAFGIAREEEGIIDSIQAGVSITLRENLTYTHTQVQADEVKKQLRHFGLPFIKYGEVTNEYDRETSIPTEDKWGAIYCDFETNFFGKEYEWKKYSHTVTVEDLEQDTTYYAKPCCFNPLGELIEGTEINFTTDVSPSYTDPGIDNVRDGTTYKFADDDKEGVLDIPIVDDVRFGVDYDNATKTGLIDLPLESEVLVGTDYDNATKTGTLEVGPKTGVVQVAVTLKNKFRVS